MSAKIYRAQLRQLHRMISKGQGDSDEADALRDEMDQSWKGMTKEECDAADRLSSKLYVFADLKERLKALEAEQREAKRLLHMDQRKWPSSVSHRIFEARHRSFTCTGSPCYWWLQPDIHKRKAWITALLNLYHEIRGTGKQHKVSTNARFYYVEARRSLSDELERKNRNVDKMLDAELSTA